MKMRRRSNVGTVYLIHFANKLHHAAHYIGFTKRLSPLKRLKDHRENHGAVILKVLNQQKIKYNVVRIWRHETREFERKLKNRKKASLICPYCTKSLKSFTYRFHRR